MVISIINSKGGVGKSTLAVHAAVWLHERGYRIAVVDADAQASTSDWLARAAPRIRLERCESVEQLRERLPRLTRVFDLVLADGPAALNNESVVLAAAADLVLMPIGPSMMDVRASYRTARLLYQVRLRGRNGTQPRVYLVLNRVQPRTRLAAVAMEAVRKYGFPLAATPIRLRQAYALACGRRSVVWRMGGSARDAAAEIDALFRQVFDPATLEVTGGGSALESRAYACARELPGSQPTPVTWLRAAPADEVTMPRQPVQGPAIRVQK